jgi:hypothetical protein
MDGVGAMAWSFGQNAAGIITALERDLGQSGRIASVDEPEARNNPVDRR